MKLEEGGVNIEDRSRADCAMDDVCEEKMMGKSDEMIGKVMEK